MERISNLVGKPVISIFDGILEGYVKNVFVDKKLKKVKWLCVFDGQTEDEKLINTKAVFKFNADAIMTKNSTQTYPSDNMDLEEINPVGYKIYKSTGIERGQIVDIGIDDNFCIENLILNNQSQVVDLSILKFGNNFLIEKSDTSEKLCNFAPKTIRDIKVSNNNVVKIQTKKHTIPTKILTSGYGFLIGRKVGQNIYAENGTMIAKKQSLITQTTIDTASKNGKLNELTKYSLI